VPATPSSSGYDQRGRTTPTTTRAKMPSVFNMSGNAVAVGSIEPHRSVQVVLGHLRPIPVHGFLIEVERRLGVRRQYRKVFHLRRRLLEFAPRLPNEFRLGQEIEHRSSQDL